ncbi:MAG TPA: phage antirepressor N-terminal domain-containing protein [Ktedonobacterales bacterium]|nr:phage antirepressor N-terminal domain-containing protein [Ktedonobacterales bacterium]
MAQEPIRPVEQDIVNLFDHSVVAVRLPDGRVAAVFTDLCAALNLDRASQRRRVRADDVIRDEMLFAEVVINGAPQPSDVLTAWAVPVWLQGIQLSRLTAEKRPPILAFKREAANVLYQHFSRRGVGTLPAPSDIAPATSVNAQQAAMLTEQIGELTDVVNLLREHLASILELPGQVEGLSKQVGQAIVMLDALSERQNTTETQVAKIDERTQRLTPAHARTVQELVDRMVRETKRLPTPLTYAIIYGRLKHRFRAGSYSEIADERYDDVLAYLREELRRATNGEAPEQSSLF